MPISILKLSYQRWCLIHRTAVTISRWYSGRLLCMENRKAISISFLLLNCLLGCERTQHRPASVPVSAVSIDRVFINCSVEESLRANRCAVYDGDSGEVQMLGLFKLSGAGREAKQAELRYAGFDGARIWLQDARSLNPVLLLEYAVPGMGSRLTALAGKNAIDCGRVTRNQNPSAASECARKAFAENEPFYVSYDERGWGGGYTVGFARGKDGNLYFVEYTSEGWPSQPPSEDVSVSGDNHVRFGPCPKPPVFFNLGNGELTCIDSKE
jgi:hypothetical protein